ncbi:mevalonate kinase [Microbacterium sp. 18062]|uniref:mevalonate kinase n=1 Tax=Microbacterium sp. 18062 TaxID=2681410 RepID=UPI00135BF9FD|nr:mevalonate kinase [Microbacterium sp. 18062]
MPTSTDIRGAAAPDPRRPHPDGTARSVVGSIGPAAGVVGIGRASGKAILFGEHAVVYGHPAIALPVTALTARAEAERTEGETWLESDLYTGPLRFAPDRLLPTATAASAVLATVGTADEGVRLRVRSDIPAERGVGSSAAVAAAIVGAVAAAFDEELDDATHHELVQAAERAAHGTPSGLDARAVRARGPIWFDRGRVDSVPVGAPLVFVVADTGVRGRTGEAVAGVRDLHAREPERAGDLIRHLGAQAAAARADLARGDVDALGARMTLAHALLDDLGVGDPALDALVETALAAGAAGAKLTGGGRGGCVLALARGGAHGGPLVDALRTAGAADVWITTVERTR